MAAATAGEGVVVAAAAVAVAADAVAISPRDSVVDLLRQWRNRSDLSQVQKTLQGFFDADQLGRGVILHQQGEAEAVGAGGYIDQMALEGPAVVGGGGNGQ